MKVFEKFDKFAGKINPLNKEELIDEFYKLPESFQIDILFCWFGKDSLIKDLKKSKKEKIRKNENKR